MISETLHRIDKNEIKAATETLVNAFSDDPVMRQLVLTQKMINLMYEMPLKNCLHHGSVLSTSENFEGVMGFCHDEKANFTLRNMLESRTLLHSLGLIKLLANKTLRSLMMTLEKDRKNLKIGPYIYLNIIGVSPEHKGKGFGKKMLEYLMGIADRENKAIYLETQTPENVQWYQTFGFEVIKELKIDWITMWEMVRKSNVSST